MTQKVIVLMLGHRSLVGKDTSAEYLKQYGWKRIAFADKLKSTVADLYGFSHEQMHGNLKDVADERYPNLVDEEYKKLPANMRSFFPIPNTEYKQFLTPRRILQIFGQDQRKIYPNIWAQYVFNQIDTTREFSSNPCQIFQYVITDFRFRNEYEVAKKWQEKEVFGPVKVEKIVLPVKINRDIVAKSGSTDISEHDLDDFNEWCAIIDNNGTVQDLYDSLNLELYLNNKLRY